MEAALPLVLNAILGLLNVVGPTAGTGVIGQIIGALSALIPALSQEATDVVPVIREIIGLVQGTEDITPEQIAQCEAMSAQLDAAFDAEATRAQAEDAAADAAAAPKPAS